MEVFMVTGANVDVERSVTGAGWVFGGIVEPGNILAVRSAGRCRRV
jgi:hypothetical protein